MMKSLQKVIVVLLLVYISVWTSNAQAPVNEGALQTTSKSMLSEYFNPYLSVGLGTDRLLLMPEIGLKIWRFRGQVGVYSDFKESEPLNVEGEVNVLKLKTQGNLTPYLSVGYMLQTRSFDVFLRSVHEDTYGGLIGMNFTKNGTRSNFGFRLGYQKTEIIEKHRDFGQVDIGETKTYGEGITIGLSYNIFLFEMVD